MRGGNSAPDLLPRMQYTHEIVDLRGGALLPERALGALEHAVGVWVVGRASWVVGRASRRA